ncbi:MAG: phage tail protein [Anaerolineales bacterium]|nr:phage tail protein [Anaerolineales bacterium]MCB0019592.1 phage tail protein [Anaerolineales bacterium]MCB8961717.1 phage tail protein [Ardenticatenales bacterium]
MAIGTDQETDPLVAFNFALEVQGVVTGYFTEVSGLGSETEVIDHLVMGANNQQIVKKVPGRLKWENIVLKRGITDQMDIWTWRKSVVDGGVDSNRHDGSVVMYNQNGTEVARWNFLKAWPAKVSGPQPKSDSNEIGIEEMTIVHEFIERVN